jgi:hypothetical protein
MTDGTYNGREAAKAEKEWSEYVASWTVDVPVTPITTGLSERAVVWRNADGRYQMLRSRLKTVEERRDAASRSEEFQYWEHAAAPEPVEEFPK